MFKKFSISPLALVLAVAACGGDDGSGASPGTPVGGTSASPGTPVGGTSASPGTPVGGTGSDNDSESGGGDNDPLTAGNNDAEPFVNEFEGIVEQGAPWGGLEIRITGARVFRGETPDDLEGQLFTRGTYGVVDVKITQLGVAETDYSDRDTWDLILADGTRERPLDGLGLVIAPGDSPTGHVYYSATDGLEFAGAVLEINGADRTTLEPMRIPLDMPATFESVADVTSLVGQTVMPATEEGELAFEILEATYGVNLPAQSDRAPFDKRLFRVVTRVSYSGNFSESFSAINDGPKVVVGGVTFDAEEGEIDTIPSGGSIDFPMLFHIDEGVTAIELEFDTQDGMTTRLPVTLPTL
jgi:hypothetical protein